MCGGVCRGGYLEEYTDSAPPSLRASICGPALGFTALVSGGGGNMVEKDEAVAFQSARSMGY